MSQTQAQPAADDTASRQSGPQSAAPTSVPPPSSSKGTILISDGAVEFAKRKLAARGTPDAAVRLGIKGGGCSGFSYVIQFDDEPPRDRDLVYEAGGVKFYVDKKSFVYLAGSVLDYERTVMFQGFKFKNPNEATSCGCGHSFTVK